MSTIAGKTSPVSFCEHVFMLFVPPTLYAHISQSRFFGGHYKYVLNSGGMRDRAELSRQFFSEVLEGLGENPKLLLCFFASPREVWEEKYLQDIESIPSLIPDEVEPIFEMAYPDTFIKTG